MGSGVQSLPPRSDRYSVDRQTKDTWSVFKIMGEFVEGFETLRPVWPSVSIFGSARTGRGKPYYREAVRVGEALSNAGYSIITGGGPGIMEAANRGAQKGTGTSIGLPIRLPAEQSANAYADRVIHFNYFFARKVMFVKYACAFVALPGGFGTLDEIFEALTLKQTGKIHDFPVILFGRSYWEGLVRWLEEQALGDRMISRKDMALFQMTDEVDEVVEIIERHYARRRRERGPKGADGRETP